MHNQFKTQKFKHLMLAMGPRDLNFAPYSPVHCSSHSMTSFQSSELTELPVVENSQLFTQRTVRPLFSLCTLCGGGGISSGDKVTGENFDRGKFRHTSNFGARPSDKGNFDTPNPWFLVDNQLCETLAGPNFELKPSSQTFSTTTNFSASHSQASKMNGPDN